MGLIAIKKIIAQPSFMYIFLKAGSVRLASKVQDYLQEDMQDLKNVCIFVFLFGGNNNLDKLKLSSIMVHQNQTPLKQSPLHSTLNHMLNLHND